MNRGEIWWADLDPTVGGEISKHRPVVVLSQTALSRRRHTIVVVPLSTGPKPRAPLTIAVPSVGSDSVAVCDQIRALDKSRLTRLVGPLDTEDLARLEDAIRTTLGL